MAESRILFTFFLFDNRCFNTFILAYKPRNPGTLLLPSPGAKLCNNYPQILGSVGDFLTFPAAFFEEGNPNLIFRRMKGYGIVLSFWVSIKRLMDALSWTGIRGRMEGRKLEMISYRASSSVVTFSKRIGWQHSIFHDCYEPLAWISPGKCWL